jgi:uncharacterized protein DUF6270
MDQRQSLRIFVLGSGVSRDLIESAPDRFRTVAHVARTSLASVGMQPVDDRQVREKVVGLGDLNQRRILLNDLDKTTLVEIDAVPHDVLLLDLIDERFNLAVSGSTFFSLSNEIENAGVSAEGRNVVTPDSEAFGALWMLGLDRLLSSADRSAVVLNRVFWAERFPDGSDAASLGWIRRNNAVLRRLYETIDRHWKLKQIQYPHELLVADPGHRWGSAPYHFVDAVRRHAVAELERLTST